MQKKQQRFYSSVESQTRELDKAVQKELDDYDPYHGAEEFERNERRLLDFHERKTLEIEFDLFSRMKVYAQEKTLKPVAQRY